MLKELKLVSGVFRDSFQVIALEFARVLEIEVGFARAWTCFRFMTATFISGRFRFIILELCAGPQNLSCAVPGDIGRTQGVRIYPGVHRERLNNFEAWCSNVYFPRLAADKP